MKFEVGVEGCLYLVVDDGVLSISAGVVGAVKRVVVNGRVVVVAAVLPAGLGGRKGANWVGGGVCGHRLGGAVSQGNDLVLGARERQELFGHGLAGQSSKKST